MNRKTHLSTKLTQLGRSVSTPVSPEKAILETINNKNKSKVFLVRFSCPEFTCLCPITGQPDFANIIIDYVPNKKIIESKSFKLFISSFRNHGAFHEDVTIKIADKIIKSAKPSWLRIGGFFNPRGGIPIDVFYQTGKTPEKIFIPEYEIKDYNGRS